MGRVIFFKYWRELEKLGAVKVTRHVGRGTMYQLDRENDVVKQNIKLDMALARKTIEKAVKESQRSVTLGPS